MALGTRNDFTMHRGDSRDLVFTIVDEDGVAVDLTGLTGADLTWAMSAQKEGVAEPQPTGEILGTALTIGAGIVLTTPASGICTVSIPIAATEDLDAPAVYYHELQLIATKTSTVSYGRMTLPRDLITTNS